jgi:hypothetical protein
VLLGLRVADPHELLGAWLAEESVSDIYLTDTQADAAVLIDKAITGFAADDVAEIRSLREIEQRPRGPRSADVNERAADPTPSR